MQAIGELELVVGKEVKEETSSGGTLVTICSRGNLSMVAGAEIGFDSVSWGRSNDGAGGAGVTKLSRYELSRGAGFASSSAPETCALLGEPFCDVCCDVGNSDRVRGSLIKVDWPSGK